MAEVTFYGGPPAIQAIAETGESSARSKPDEPANRADDALATSTDEPHDEGPSQRDRSVASTQDGPRRGDPVIRDGSETTFYKSSPPVAEHFNQKTTSAETTAVRPPPGPPGVTNEPQQIAPTRGRPRSNR
jgi:hypothetical protein